MGTWQPGMFVCLATEARTLGLGFRMRRKDPWGISVSQGWRINLKAKVLSAITLDSHKSTEGFSPVFAIKKPILAVYM